MNSRTDKLEASLPLSIGELADEAGVTRRVVRFYVQRELIPPPEGKGRGSHYSTEHLQLIRRIQKMQAVGHSLDEIKTLLESPVPVLPSSQFVKEELVDADRIENKKAKVTRSAPRHVRTRAKARVNAGIWTRIEVMPGVELNVDIGRYQLSADELSKLKEIVEKAMRR